MKRRILLVVAVVSLLASSALPTAAWGNCVQFYRVFRGDTLASIARAFGTTFSYLASINGISNPNRIFAGQVICVQVSNPPPQQTTYVVRRGDWLTLIAFRFGVSLFDLIRANNLPNPNFIFPGEVLIIPISTGFQMSAPSGMPLNQQPPVYTPPMGGGVQVPPPASTPEF